MLAQSAAFIVRAEQAAPLQFWHDQGAEGVELAGEPGRHDVEAVGRAAFEARLQFIGYLRRRADDPPMAARAGKMAGKLADGEAVAARLLDDQRLPALHPLALRQFRQRPVDRV